MKIRRIKLWHWILAAVLVGLVIPFVFWIIMPTKALQIVVLNKTFPVETSSDGKITSLDYSKQRGLFWIMDYLSIENPATGKPYVVTTDYYGNVLTGGELVNKPLNKLINVPDIIYLSDTYGTGNSKVNGGEPKGISGLTKDEVGLIVTCYAKGTTVIGEYNILGDPTKENVSKELEGVFGVGFTGWAGKFFSDLSSEDDVPNWIRTTYERQYGKKWAITGAGIVIAGKHGIIILQRGKDFSEQSIRLSMDEDNAKAFNTGTVDFYNWFEIVTPVDDKSVIAWYDLNLTAEGKDQMKLFGLDGRFPAIIANRVGINKSYYFAGDFCDYREPAKIYSFLGAAGLYKLFSIESEGEYSYFYWNFYVPFMSTLIKEVEPLDKSVTSQAEAEVDDEGTQLVSKVTDGHFSVFQKGVWNKLYVKGVNIGPALPGIPQGSFSDDNTIYSQWLEDIGSMNANCISVNTLMPNGFYRALDIYNSNNPDKSLYFFQNISINSEPPSGDFLDQGYNAAYKKAIEDTINAIHGNASIKIKDEQEFELYINDVSRYVLGYLADPSLNPVKVVATDMANSQFTYQGGYVSSGLNATPTESWLASVCDEIYQYEEKNYNMQHPVAITSIPELDTLDHVKVNPNSKDNAVSVDINNIDISSQVKCGFFATYDIFPDQPGFLSGETDEAKPAYAGYKEYMNRFMKTQEKYPVLISGVGLSTSMGSSQIGAVGYQDGQHSETMQGEGIVSMMNIIKDSGCMGALVYEWTDEWGKRGPFTSSLTIPYERGNLWHNRTEPAQNYGILALESSTPKDYAMSIRGSDPLESIAYTANESYFYVKAIFSKLPNFNQKSIMIYLDTIDRKNGEYMLAPDVNENWSGVEYNINFQNEKQADLLVVPNYNASNGSYFTAVTTTGIFAKILRQLSPAYTTALGETISAKYEDGSTLIAGSFDDSNNNFYFEGNTLYLRIPWARLNFTDPSSRLVLDDNNNKGIVKDTKDALAVRMTDGIVASLVIMDKTTQNVDYHFPESATASGYKTFTWSTWDAPNYVTRNKKSYDIIKRYFAE